MRTIYNLVNLMRKDLMKYFRHLRLRSSLQRNGVFLASNATIIAKMGSFSFNRGCSIGSYSIIDVCNAPSPQTNEAHLFLGTHVYIGDHCNIRAAGANIHIGSNSMIANGVTIIGSNHRTDIGILLRLQPWDMERSGVTIGEDCWIGAGAIILPGATIGDGVVVAAGAVVRGNIPTGSIVAGVPARVVKVRQ